MSTLIHRIVLKLKHEDIWKLLSNKFRIFFTSKEKKDILDLQSQVESLYELLSMSIDITSLKPADGPLKKIHDADTKLLTIFDLICNKYKLTYWIDYGTLLGAVRHGGFIPWDDDIDVSMVRSDYDNLEKILDEELSQYGFQVNHGKGFDVQVIRLMLPGTPIQLDVFPYDPCYLKIESDDDMAIFKESVKKANKKLYKMVPWEDLYYGEKPFPYDLHKQITQELQGNKSDHIEFYFTGIEYIIYDNVQTITTNELFPLKRIGFNGINLPAPNEIDIHLRGLYSDYMKFPNFKILGHANINLTKNIDLEKESRMLDDVAQSIEGKRVLCQ